MPSFCAVVGCSNRSNREKDKNYFGFPGIRDNRGRDLPEGIKRRALWLKAVRRADLTARKIRNASICADHFITGRPSEDSTHPDYAPSQKMGYTSAGPVGAGAEHRHKRAKKRLLVESTTEITTSHQELEIKPLEFVEVEDFSASTNGESLEQPSPSTITTNPPPDTSMVVVQPSSSQMEHGIKRKVDPPTTNPTAKKLHQTSDNSSVPEDEYELFCRSLICQLRNMPVDRAVICQEKLQSVMTQERLYQMGINYEQKSEPMVYDNIIVKEETDIDVNSSEY